jgi:hypothetical protein
MAELVGGERHSTPPAGVVGAAFDGLCDRLRKEYRETPAGVLGKANKNGVVDNIAVVAVRIETA